MIATLADLWYVVSLRLWPAAAPHIATRLHLVDAVRDGDRSEDLLEMVGA